MNKADLQLLRDFFTDQARAGLLVHQKVDLRHF